MLQVEVQRRQGAFRLDVRFEGSAGVTALFGRSGAGKTSIVEMIAGLRRPDAGRIVVDDVVLFDAAARVDLPPERRRLGYVFQESRLFPHLSVRGNLRYGMRRDGGQTLDFDAVVDVLALAGLLEQRPHELSGGERQRVALGRAVLSGPRLLLMDEPLAGLDRGLRLEILPFVEHLRDALRIPVVYVSHNMDEVMRLADTLVLVSDGRIAASGPVEEITSRIDLSPLTGRWEAGAVLAAEVRAHEPRFALTELAFAGGRLLVPRLALPAGSRLRVRIRARDVSLALAPPERISVLNVFRGRVLQVGARDEPQVDVLVDVGARLWSRVTRRSLEELGLAPGVEVYALVKAVAVDRHSVGGLPIAGAREG